MHFNNLTIWIWREADEGKCSGQDMLAAEFSENVTVLAARRNEAAVKPRNYSRLYHCPRLRSAARPSWGSGGRWAA
jgi:hypothetical protein